MLRSFLSLTRITGCLLACCTLVAARGDDALFSGPQVGEKISSFEVRGVLDADAGKTIDFVAEAQGKPTLLIFVHEVTRPSIAFLRVLSEYARTRAKDGLTTGIVWLDNDATAAENSIKRMRHALPHGVRIGVSPDGEEGPGSYGLNRNVMLTIVLAKENKATANFALVQPSIPSDLPKVLGKIVDLVGGTVPKLDDLMRAENSASMRSGVETDEQLNTLLRAVIRKDARPEDVDKAARDLEAYVSEHEKARNQVGRIANTIVGSGKLSNYGTPTAQEYLRKWARAYPSEPTTTSTPQTKDSKPSAPATQADQGDKQ